MYVPLYVKSHFSFLEGASSPEELVEYAHGLGLPALALTDRDGVYGIVRAHMKAKALGMPLIVGAEITLGLGASDAKVIVLARDRPGYAGLCRLISLGRARCPKGSARVIADELRAITGGVVVLTRDTRVFSLVKSRFGDDAYALLTRHLGPDEPEQELALRSAAASAGLPLVAAMEVLYHDRARRRLQDLVTCIRHGRTLAGAGTCIHPNAEHDMLDVAAMRARYADVRDALERTLEVAERCTFRMGELKYTYPSEKLPDGRTEHEHLTILANEGAHRRYGSVIPDAARAQLDKELLLIGDLEYDGYFLTMHEIVAYCGLRGILCQGRGSAANSVVCYVLGVTAVDPIEGELLFERFLSRERAEPPDIDLDIEHERREEVIQHVYARFGRRHSAMVANLIRYRPRSAVRDVGKVLEIPTTKIDGIAHMLSHYADVIPKEVLIEAGLDPEAHLTKLMFELCQEILDVPRHLSIHPGGFLLGHEPVDAFVPIEPATMEQRTVIQWDKYDVEALGLFKVDLLGLGALTVIKKCFDLVALHEGEELHLAGLPTDDPTTYAMIQAGDTVGVFQIESRAQMSMLPRLKPAKFYDLVIEVAIVRPGPIQGGMVHPYLRRRMGEEPVEYPHPALRQVLARTMGVPIFQEQVMKLAVLIADYTPGEADGLRRDMAAWKSSGKIEQHRVRLITRMIANGIEPDYAERIFSQIRGFGEYGFPESHAASFALLAYATAYLRCHHPEAFLCAMLNAQPMGFYSPSTLIEDGKRHGVALRPIDLLASEWDCTLERTPTGHAVRMGLRYVKGLGERERARIEAAKGCFHDLESFVRATRLSLNQYVRLAEAGAFDGIGLSRRDALWRVRGLVSEAGDDVVLERLHGGATFRALDTHDAITWDHEVTFHSTRGHPMQRFRELLRSMHVPDSAEVRAMKDGTRADYVGMVICRQRPGTASGVTFFTLEDEVGFVNLVVWVRVFEQYERIARTAGLLGVHGLIQSKDGVVHLIAEKLWVPGLEGGARMGSRDFH